MTNDPDDAYGKGWYATSARMATEKIYSEERLSLCISLYSLLIRIRSWFSPENREISFVIGFS